MSKEKDFFKTCFNTVAGLEVTNESQAIAKEVVLNEIENLQQQVKEQKEIIDKIFNYLEDKYGYSLTKGTINDTDVTELYEILKEVSE